MKKLLALLLIGGAFFAVSCDKKCDCTEKVIGYKETVDLGKGEWKSIKNCKDLQKELNKASMGELDWSCK